MFIKAEFLITLICISAIFFMISNYPSWNTAKYICAIIIFYFLAILGLMEIRSKSEQTKQPITKETIQIESSKVEKTNT